MSPLSTSGFFQFSQSQGYSNCFFPVKLHFLRASRPPNTALSTWLPLSVLILRVTLAGMYVSHSVVSSSLRPHGLYLPGSSVHETLQARILDRVAISYSRGSSQPGYRTQVSCTAGRFFTIWATREALGGRQDYFFVINGAHGRSEGWGDSCSGLQSRRGWNQLNHWAGLE